MVQAIFCAHSKGSQIDEAVSKLTSEGIQPTAITVVSHRQDLDWLSCPQKRMNLSLARGIIGGAIIGAVIGLGMVLYMGSAHNPWGEASMVMWESFGWALFGMIVGSGGLFGKAPMPEALLHHLEQAMNEGKILVSLQVKDRNDLDRAAACLYQVGAADMHETKALVA